MRAIKKQSEYRIPVEEAKNNPNDLFWATIDEVHYEIPVEGSGDDRVKKLQATIDEMQRGKKGHSRWDCGQHGHHSPECTRPRCKRKGASKAAAEDEESNDDDVDDGPHVKSTKLSTKRRVYRLNSTGLVPGTSSLPIGT